MTRLALITSAALVALLIVTATAIAAFRFQTAWGTAGAGAGQFNNPGMPAVGPDGSVYVPDTANNRVEKFTGDGAFVSEWGTFGAGAGQFDQPLATAVGPDGSVYVVDGNNHRVQRFSAGGGFLSAWGTQGAGDGQFGTMAGIAAGPDGSIYVADVTNKRVEKFLADGTFLRSFTSGAGGFVTIAGVAADPNGLVYVVDTGADRVEEFDSNGVFQTTWGSAGARDGQFQNPQGVAASGAGVYVADVTQSRVQKFSSTGTFLDSLDAAGTGDVQLSAPAGVAISSATGEIYVSQPASARIARYGETTSNTGSNLPPPQTGQTANAQPVGGNVRVKKPGSSTFTVLVAGEQIPIGSIVDVTHGTVDLTTTAGGRKTQTARFYSGVFKLTQTTAAKPVTELRLFGGDFTSCAPSRSRKASAARKKKVVRQLWGSGKGRFRTKGRYASAAIRGTQWLTQDRCDGTLVRVKQGVVSVRDFVRRKNVTVRAPKSYLATAR